MESFFYHLSVIDQFFWSYIGFAIVCAMGVYLTILSKGTQFKVLKSFRKNFQALVKQKSDLQQAGINPIKLYFASTGGMIGLGNVVGISAAICIGGPGSIFWMWMASLCGMLIKYSEIYLGIKYRIIQSNNQYAGGSLYYLKAAFNTKVIASISALLLCIYGAEVYQFTVLVSQVQYFLPVNRLVIIIGLLALVLYSSLGGIKRLSNICAAVMPIFIIGYIALGLYIVGINYMAIPTIFAEIFTHAFTSKAPLGGFAGSGMLTAAYIGTSKTVYSGDIGIGYDSMVQSETTVSNPKDQARISIYALFTDTMICTVTALIILTTGALYNIHGVAPSDLITGIISHYVVGGSICTAALLFVAGFTTVIAYLTVGFKAAHFLSPKYSKPVYIVYSILAFIICAQYSEEKVVLIMSIASGLLVLINLLGIFKLHKEIEW